MRERDYIGFDNMFVYWGILLELICCCELKLRKTFTLMLTTLYPLHTSQISKQIRTQYTQLHYINPHTLQEILQSYRQEGLLRSQNLGDSNAKPLGPHVYSIADSSYRQMMSEQRKSQSILISGESGAGKTETTKIVMLYLTTLGSAETPEVEVGVEEIVDNGKLSIMERVLQSNPILEAFGNAKTLRNDNSSRFGKFIELGFNRAGVLQGAKQLHFLTIKQLSIGIHQLGS